MIVEKRHIDGFTLLVVEGVIKLGESAQFFAQTLDRSLANDDGHVVIDFSGINYIDSTGIGELVGYLGRFGDQSRKLILVNPSERITKLLEVARLAPLFPTYDSMEEAMRQEARPAADDQAGDDSADSAGASGGSGPGADAG